MSKGSDVCFAYFVVDCIIKKRANFSVCSLFMKKSLPYSKTILLIAYRLQIYSIIINNTNFFDFFWNISLIFVL